MKNIKEIQAILTSIFVLNETSKQKNKEISSICSYAFYRLFDANTNLLLLATIGQSYDTIKEQVSELLRLETKYHDKAPW